VLATSEKHVLATSEKHVLATSEKHVLATSEKHMEKNDFYEHCTYTHSSALFLAYVCMYIYI
jgi:hypothetical protein